MTDDIEIGVGVDLKAVADLRAEVAGLLKVINATQTSMDKMSESGTKTSQSYKDQETALKRLQGELRAVKRALSEQTAENAAIRAAQAANKQAAAQATVTAAVRSGMQVYREAAAVQAAAAAQSSRQTAGQVSDLNRVLDMEQDLRDARRAMADDIASVRSALTLGAPEGISSTQMALAKTREEVQKLETALAELRATTGGKALIDTRDVLASKNALGSLEGAVGDIIKRFMAEGPAIDTATAAVDRHLLSLRKVEIAAASQKSREQIAAYKAQIAVMDEMDAGLDDLVQSLTAEQAKLAALKTQTEQVTIALSKMSVEGRQAAKAAQEQAAAAAALAASQEREAAALQRLGTAYVAADIAKQRAEYGFTAALEHTQEAQKRLAETQKKYGTESRATATAQKQYDATLIALAQQVSTLAKAEVVATKATAAYNHAIAQAAPDQTHLNGVIGATTAALQAEEQQIKDVTAASRKMRAALKESGMDVQPKHIGAGIQRPLQSADDLHAIHNNATIYNRGLGVFNETLGKIATTASIAQRQVHSLIAILATLTFVHLIMELDLVQKSLAAITRDMNATHAAIQQAMIGTAAYADALAYLTRVSDDYQQRVKDLAGSYILLTSSTDAAGIPLEKARAAYEGIIAASKVLGKSNEDTKGSLMALSQIASKGVVSMEEMRQQLGERLPGALNILADAMHIPMPELIKQITAGNISAQEFFDVFGPEILARFGVAGKEMHTLGGAVNELKQNFDTLLKTSMSAGLTTGLMLLVQAFSDLMTSMAAGTGIFTTVGQALRTIGIEVQAFADALTPADFAAFTAVLGTVGAAFSAAYEVAKSFAATLGAMITLLSDIGVFTALSKVLQTVAFYADLVGAALAAWAIKATAVMIYEMIRALAGWALGMQVVATETTAAATSMELLAAAMALVMTPIGLVVAAVSALMLIVGLLAVRMRNTAGATIDAAAAMENAKASGLGLTTAMAAGQQAVDDQSAAYATLNAALVDNDTANNTAAASAVAAANDRVAATRLEVAASLAKMKLDRAQLELAKQQQQAAADAMREKMAQTIVPGEVPPGAEMDAFMALDTVIQGAVESAAHMQARLEGILASGGDINKYERAWLDAEVALQKVNAELAIMAANQAAVENFLSPVFNILTGIGDATTPAVDGLQGVQNVVVRMLETYSKMTDTIRAAKMERMAFDAGGTAAYEKMRATAAAAEDLRGNLKDANKAIGGTEEEMAKVEAASNASNAAIVNLVRQMAAGGNAAAQLALDTWDAETAARATADAATAIVSIIAAAVQQARNLRAQLGSQAVETAWVKEDTQLILDKVAALKAGDQATANSIDTQMANNDIMRDGVRANTDLTAAFSDRARAAAEAAGTDAAALAAATRATLGDLALTDALVAGTNEQTAAQLAKAEAVRAAAKAQDDLNAATKSTGGGGGGGGAAKEAARDMLADLKLLDKATMDAKGSTAQLSQEYVELAAAYERVGAVYTNGVYDMEKGGVRIHLELARIKERMDQLRYGTVNLFDTLTESVTSLAGGLGDAWGDFLMSGLRDTESFTKSIMDMFKTLLRSILTAIMQNKIIIPIQTAIVNGMNGTMPAGVGFFGKMLGNVGAAMTQFSTTFASSFGSILSGDFAGALSSIGTASAAAGGGIAGLGATLGALAGPLAVVGGLFAAFRKTTKILAQGFKIAVEDMNSITVNAYTRKQTSRFFGLIKKTKTSTSDAGQAGDAITSHLSKMFATVADAAKLMNLSQGAFDGFFDSVRTFAVDLMGLSEEDAAAKVSQWLNDTASELVDFGFGALQMSDALKDVALEGETSYDTFIRMATSLRAVNNMLTALGNTLLPLSLAGGAAAAALTELFGGVENFLSATANYINLFYTTQEQAMMENLRLQQGMSELNAQFTGLNLTMPTTAAGLRAMVDGLDLTSKAGQESFAFLVQNANGFKLIFDAIANGTEEIQSLEKDRSDIIAELTRRYDQMRASEQALADARASLAGSDLAPGTEMTQLGILQQQFNDAIAGARGGDTDAATQAARLAQELLQQGQLVYGSSVDYGALFKDVNTALVNAQIGMDAVADSVGAQLDTATFEDVTRKSTNALLEALAALDTRIELLRQQQEDQFSSTRSNAQRKATGTR